jgi:hypothetical protein
MRILWLSTVLFFSIHAPAQAIELSQRGAAIILQGKIKPGDEFILRGFLARTKPGQIKAVYLNSTGGFIFPAREMAREIRKAGLVTVVDAARSKCHSACTGLFVAGVRRHYINASAIADGDGTKTGGLGFHEGSAPSQRKVKDYSGRGTAGMINIYYEMGVPGAATVISRAPYTRIYTISGATALSMGIATSLAAP